MWPCPTHGLTVVERHVCICFAGELWHFVQQRFEVSSGGTGNRASGAFGPQHLRGMATGASPMDAEEQRQSGAVAAAEESTSASATSFTPTAGYRGCVAAVSAEHSGDAPADGSVVVAGGAGAGGDEGVAGEGAAAAATGDEALTRPGRADAAEATEAAEVVLTGAAPPGRVKLNVWHVPMHAWRVTEMWVKPDATWNQVKHAVQHSERRRGPYWSAPRVPMHRVVGRDDGLWYHWQDRVMDPPATSPDNGREDLRTNMMWRDGYQMAHGLAADMFFAEDPVILEDTKAVKSVVMVPNLDFEWPGHSE